MKTISTHLHCFLKDRKAKRTLSILLRYIWSRISRESINGLTPFLVRIRAS